MFTTTTLRRSAILGMLALVNISGCASMQSPKSWFARDPVADMQKKERSLAAKASGTSTGITGQFKSMGTAVSSAFGKAKTAVTSTFTAKPEGNDPTSLSTMHTNLGPEIWVTNGQLYESQSNFPKALDNYTKALELEPTNQAALLSTARLYARQGKPEQAVEFFNKSLANKPDPATYSELSAAYKQLGNSAQAQATIEKAIALEPASSRYRNNLAGILVANGRSDEAVKQLESVFPPAIANYNVAYLHFANNNVAGAQQHLQTALVLDPNLGQARDLMAKISTSETATTALAAYGTANNIYRTAESLVMPTVPANTAVYQPPTNGFTNSAPAPASR